MDISINVGEITHFFTFFLLNVNWEETFDTAKNVFTVKYFYKKKIKCIFLPNLTITFSAHFGHKGAAYIMNTNTWKKKLIEIYCEHILWFSNINCNCKCCFCKSQICKPFTNLLGHIETNNKHSSTAGSVCHRCEGEFHSKPQIAAITPHFKAQIIKYVPLVHTEPW